MSDMLPDIFVSQLQEQLGPAGLERFLAALAEPPPVSIRLNPRKCFTLEENAGKVKWYNGGVYLSERPVFTLDPRFHAGAYYVQEAASMFVAEAVRQTLDLAQPLRVLDLAAAPGGKSTLLASLLSPDSVLLANEVIRSRYGILMYNLTKWGYPNTLASNHDPEDFQALKDFFDLVLVDAPCSGEGLFRKDKAAIKEWSPDNVRLCSARQRRILAHAAALVRPGGVLLYSTCTYNDEENARNARWLQSEAGFEYLSLSIPEEWQIVNKEPGYQFYPHLTQSEGFYLACFRRPREQEATQAGKPAENIAGWQRLPRQQSSQMSQWVDQSHEFAFFINAEQTVRAVPAGLVQPFAQIATALRRVNWGVEVGQFKGQDFIPSPALALSLIVSPGIPAVELSERQALQYLKREPIELPSSVQGWALVRFQGHNLGWVKALKNRVNNYYPKEWRILMDLPPADA